MNVLMVNAVDPATPHISGVRAWRFSQELATLGNRVVLLCAGDQVQSDRVDVLVRGHEWQEPLVIALPDASEPDKSSIHLLRKARTALDLLRFGGRRLNWLKQATDRITDDISAFRPDIVWCTFGLLESVFAAKRIAVKFGCPWVLDVKDNWELYVPRGLRGLMNWRIKGWSAISANAMLTSAMAAKWQRSSSTVVYSGVDSGFYPTHEVLRARSTEFVINLIGSIYLPKRLAEFFDGIRFWLDRVPSEERAKVTIRYIGNDSELVKHTAMQHLPRTNLEVEGYVPIAQMAQLCKSAAINAYIAFSATFHHKLLELLATGRPVVAYPSESKESIDLAASFAGNLIVTESPEALSQVISEIYGRWQTGDSTVSAPSDRAFSWPSQAQLLEHVLLNAINANNQKHHQ